MSEKTGDLDTSLLESSRNFQKLISPGIWKDVPVVIGIHKQVQQNASER
jgi:hypothetical protein